MNHSFFLFLAWLLPEYVYDTKLRRAMNLDKDTSSATAATTKSNPDDDLF